MSLFPAYTSSSGYFGNSLCCIKCIFIINYLVLVVLYHLYYGYVVNSISGTAERRDTEGFEVVGNGCPHPTGERLLEGGCAPPKKLFIIIFFE